MQKELKKREGLIEVTSAKEADIDRLREVIKVRWDSKKPDEINQMKSSHSEK